MGEQAFRGCVSVLWGGEAAGFRQNCRKLVKWFLIKKKQTAKPLSSETAEVLLKRPSPPKLRTAEVLFLKPWVKSGPTLKTTKIKQHTVYRGTDDPSSWYISFRMS